MKPNKMAAGRSKPKATNRLFDQAADPKALILLARADHLGRPGAEILKENEDFLWTRLARFEETMKKPFVGGKDLIEAGLEPGPGFSALLDYAHKLRLAEIDKETALKQVLGLAKQQQKENGKPPGTGSDGKL